MKPPSSGPMHRRDAEYAAEETLVAAAIARRHDVADDRDRGDDEAAAAEALDDAEGDQLGKVLRQAAQRASRSRKMMTAACSTMRRP